MTQTAEQCKALRQQDEMVCVDCGIRWDVHEPTPDACAVKPKERKPYEGVLRRVLKGLGLHPSDMAKAAGVRTQEVLDKLDLQPGQVSDVDLDPIWIEAARMCDERLGLLLAARNDLQAMLQRHKTERAARADRIRSR